MSCLTTFMPFFNATKLLDCTDSTLSKQFCTLAIVVENWCLNYVFPLETTEIESLSSSISAERDDSLALYNCFIPNISAVNVYIVSESSLSSDLHGTALLCGVGTRTIDGVDILSEDSGAGTDADLVFLEVLRTSLSSGDADSVTEDVIDDDANGGGGIL